MSEEHRSWLYAVTRALNPAVLGRLSGVAGETPHVVEGTRLTAVAGLVPACDFGQEALHRNLEDLDWLDRVARAHNTVVDALARLGPTVPLRLATLYLDDLRVRLAVDEHEPEFERTLHHVAGRTEWGVKALLDPARLTEPDCPVWTDAPGAAYLRRMRSTLLARERAERFGAEQAERIHAALAALAVDARRHRPQDPQLTGEKLPMILNAAYLVVDDSVREFEQAVARHNHTHEAIQLRLTGPWPPYSFSVSFSPRQEPA